MSIKAHNSIKTEFPKMEGLTIAHSYNEEKIFGRDG